MSVVTSVLTYLTILIGGFTRGSGAGLGCGDDWPLCSPLVDKFYDTVFFEPL